MPLITSAFAWKTAFYTPPRHFEYIVMLFGPTSEPAIFQALINVVLQDFQVCVCVLGWHPYPSLDEHVAHVGAVPQRL